MPIPNIANIKLTIFIGFLNSVKSILELLTQLKFAAYDEQGLALLGYLKNVSPQLKPNFVLKVEDKY